MSSIGWVFGVLRQNGIDTKGMSAEEAFDELEKLRQQERDNYSNQEQSSAKRRVSHLELHKRLNNKEWEKSLSDDQKASVRSYTSYSDHINNVLDGKDKTDSLTENRIKNIDDSIDNYELKEPITVYKHVNQNNVKGNYFKNRGFTSTSISEEHARNRARLGGVIYVIKVPACKGIGAYINDISCYKDEEYEFLLGRGLSFREVDKEDKNGIKYIHWEIND